MPGREGYGGAQWTQQSAVSLTAAWIYQPLCSRQAANVRADQYGVLGIATGFGAAGVGTWDDTKQLAGDIGGMAKSAWHGIASLL